MITCDSEKSVVEQASGTAGVRVHVILGSLALSLLAELSPVLGTLVGIYQAVA